jgi:CheY-like chemotaxis protein
VPVFPPWQILCVDDEEVTARQIKEYLEDEVIDGDGSVPVVSTETRFDKALERLAEHRFDLMILDVRLGEGHEEEDEGVLTLERIRASRFVPVIFYTNIPHRVADLETALVRVVSKADDDQLLAAVRDILNTEVPRVNRELIRHFESVQRDYMWSFVAENWEEFWATEDRRGLAHLLARRLAVSLSGRGVEELATALGAAAGEDPSGRVEPMRYYVLPFIEKTPLAGDIFRGTIRGVEGHWLLLTPSCDLAREPPRAEWVLMARCLPLEEQSEFQAWGETATPSTAKTKALEGLITNNRKDGKQPDRYYFLPAALTLPNLVVDLQQIERVPCADLDGLTRLASLDSPFAEALITRFTRYYGRLGTPDLNVASVVAGLHAADREDAPAE